MDAAARRRAGDHRIPRTVLKNLAWPLMKNNITRSDLDAVIAYLRRPDPMLTHSRQVRAFEREWSAWLGVKHSVFVNSGASANLLTMAALRQTRGPGEIVVPPLTWVSDIAAVLQCGFTPVFADIDPRTLGLDTGQVLKKITRRTRAVFLTHILGYNALSWRLLAGLKQRGIPLIEDVSESHGATFGRRKLGAHGLMSNFSFYYAHHMSTIEGGMVCTNDRQLYETVRMLRSHGLVRESGSEAVKRRYERLHPDLTPDFIFAMPGYNVRPTELNAVLGRAQLKRLDRNNRIRTRNLDLFLDNLDPGRYRTDFERRGSSNYAFTLVLKQPDPVLRDAVVATLRRHGVEYRRGTSGGGNQLRQPYLRHLGGTRTAKRFPECDHVHFFGFYIGNYPALEPTKIRALCQLLNRLPAGNPA
jgi:CDP-4-dehydro-6-deoxyglucose reductase, E1